MTTPSPARLDWNPVNRDALVDMLVTPLRPSDPTATLIEGQQIEGPCWMPADPERFAAESTGASVDRLLEAMRRAVTDAVHGATRVAVLATGGVDSAVVAALASEVTGSGPLLLALDGGLLAAEERQRLDLLGDVLGSEVLVLDGPFRFDVAALEQLNRRARFPRGGVFSGAWAMAARALEARGFDRALTGEGANEVFSPGGSELIDLVRAGELATAIVRYGLWRDTDSPEFMRGLWRAERSRYLPIKTWHTAADRTLGWAGVDRDETRASLRRWRDRIAAEEDRGLSSAEIHCRLRLEGLADAAALDPEQRVGFEHPLGNEEVISAHFSAPLANRYPRSGWSPDKFLLRVAARRMLPPELTESPKIGVSDQIATLATGVHMEFDGMDREAITWLGLRDFPAQPQGLPSAAALDWTQNRALIAWARQAILASHAGRS